jgi:hypothetical protein
MLGMRFMGCQLVFGGTLGCWLIMVLACSRDEYIFNLEGRKGKEAQV